MDESTPPPLPGKEAASSVELKNDPVHGDWSTEPPRPWRRYFARTLDILASCLVVGILLGTLLLSVSPKFYTTIVFGPQYELLLGLFILFLTSFVNAAFIGFTGGSIGKWFFGIRVTDNAGRPIGYSAAIKRELMVWFRGLGLGIPIVTLVTTIRAFIILRKEGRTTWDRDLHLQVRYRSSSSDQIFIWFVGVAVIILLMVVYANL